MTNGFPIQDFHRRPPTTPQHLPLINPVWSINFKRSMVWRRSGAREPEGTSQPQISLVNRTRRVPPIHALTLRRSSQHLQIPLAARRLGAKTPRASRESRRLPLISTLSHPEVHRTSTDRNTHRPLLPPGALRLLPLITLALEPLPRLQDRGT
jgi:hypothetical protein